MVTDGQEGASAVGKVIRYRRRRKPTASGKQKSGNIGRILFALFCAGAAGFYGAEFVPDMASAARSAAPSLMKPDTAALVGRASVIDGDTIEIHGERIRFNGVDAPESSQLCKDGGGKDYRCGAKSADALAKYLAASSPTKCEFVERDQYGRFVGNCSRADGQSVQRWLVNNGHAMDWPRYSGGVYAADQKAAKAKKVGIWQGEFEPPWEWRAAQRQPVESPIAPLMTSTGEGGCKIKGNISSKGERIYHVPGQEHYDRTRISESKGERWFCSEAEARSAGWRRSRR